MQFYIPKPIFHSLKFRKIKINLKCEELILGS